MEVDGACRPSSQDGVPGRTDIGCRYVVIVYGST